MTLTEIYDRIKDLQETIKKNPEDQDRIFNCEMKIAELEQFREDLEEGLQVSSLILCTVDGETFSGGLPL